MAGRPTECPKGFNSIQHQTIMCICQIYGKDFTQDPIGRLKELAAEEGGALAGLFLGDRFLQSREYRSAAKMFTCAYENKCARAAYELYLLYENGQGVGMDRIASKKYLEEAARMGDAFSMNEYGKELYGKKNVYEAAAWFEKAYLRNIGAGGNNLVTISEYVD